MKFRIYFEPHEKMRINDIEVFKYYGGNYLADFNVHFGGYISMNALDKVGTGFEPVWQFLMDDVTDEDVEILDYIKNNPMNGYYVHVYAEPVGKNAHKIL